MTNVLHFRDKEYPEFISTGNHARYIMPVAKEIIGKDKFGYDIGCKKSEWSYPGSYCIDPVLNEFHAHYLPTGWCPEYIFSSHCLEHVPEWEKALQHWYDKLVTEGIVFLYLPHIDNEYWDTRFMPTGRHVNNLSPQIVKYVLENIGFKNVFSSERDAAYSFCVYGEK